MSDRTEIIYTAGRIDEALLLQGLLAERDIESVIENEALQSAVGGLPAGESTAPRVRVSVGDADKALQVVRMFERQARVGPLPELIIDDETTWHNWPRCPECDARRQTICPICHVAASEFALAEYNPPAEKLLSRGGAVDELPLLMCPTCDEAFTPRFYRRCAWCGHDFSDGIEVGAEHEEKPEVLNARVWVAIGGLIAVCAAILGYFWWLMR